MATSSSDVVALTAMEIQTKICSDIEFSMSLADPFHPDCIMVAVSQGFTDLTGYSEEECVGHNCRFLVDGVPKEFKEQVDQETRTKVRQWIKNVRDVLMNPDGEEVIEPFRFMQLNAKKNGKCFRNCILLDIIYASCIAGSENSILRTALKDTDLVTRPLCVGIQLELEVGDETPTEALLEEHMARLKRVRDELYAKRMTGQIKTLQTLQEKMQK